MPEGYQYHVISNELVAIKAGNICQFFCIRRCSKKTLGGSSNIVYTLLAAEGSSTAVAAAVSSIS